MQFFKSAQTVIGCSMLLLCSIDGRADHTLAEIQAHQCSSLQSGIIHLIDENWKKTQAPGASEAGILELKRENARLNEHIESIKALKAARKGDARTYFLELIEQARFAHPELDRERQVRLELDRHLLLKLNAYKRLQLPQPSSPGSETGIGTEAEASYGD